MYMPVRLPISALPMPARLSCQLSHTYKVSASFFRPHPSQESLFTHQSGPSPPSLLSPSSDQHVHVSQVFVPTVASIQSKYLNFWATPSAQESLFTCQSGPSPPSLLSPSSNQHVHTSHLLVLALPTPTRLLCQLSRLY